VQKSFTLNDSTTLQLSLTIITGTGMGGQWDERSQSLLDRAEIHDIVKKIVKDQSATPAKPEKEKQALNQSEKEGVVLCL
jgi:hypothetical protein